MYGNDIIQIRGCLKYMYKLEVTSSKWEIQPRF